MKMIISAALIGIGIVIGAAVIGEDLKQGAFYSAEGASAAAGALASSAPVNMPWGPH